MPPIRVLIADDHTMVRECIVFFLRTLADLDIVGQACDGQEAIDLVKQRQPDVLLLDLVMPNGNGQEVLERVVREAPATRVLILSGFAHEIAAADLMKAGAVGIIAKTGMVPELELAIRAVMRGQTYLSPSVSTQLAHAHGAAGGATEPALTSRQREILKLIAEGHGTKEIARRLHISAKTVENHRLNLMARLGIHEVAGLVRYAIQKGIVAFRDK